MHTAQLLFRTRNTKNADEVLDKVQGYLAALLHHGQIVGDHTPMAKVSGGHLVTASVPETDVATPRRHYLTIPNPADVIGLLTEASV
jgi:hypothetical protein